MTRPDGDTTGLILAGGCRSLHAFLDRIETVGTVALSSVHLTNINTVSDLIDPASGKP